MDETRLDLGTNTGEVSDATQRLNVQTAGRPQRPKSTGPRPSSADRRKATAEKKKKEKILVITLCSVAAVLLIAAIIGIISLVGSNAPKDGVIMDNVWAAGVNLGGKTPKQAKDALHQATDNTFSKLDMKVTVLDSQILLSPTATGATLNVDAVVEAAYNYGRSGNQTQGASYTVSILPYLSLDTNYIQNQIKELGKQYSTTKTPTTHSVEGTRPNLTAEHINTSTVHQTLTIQMGTAEYSLNIDKLYQQVLDAYNINLFEVVGTCAEDAPDPVDLDALFDLYCTEAVNAEIDPETLQITPEQYGYGVTREELRTRIENAKYGETITLELRYIKPDITADFYSKEMFQDTLATYSTMFNANEAWNTNLKLVCDILNGTIVKSGEEFSFNNVVGEPTIRDGYFAVNTYVGKSYREVVGGGISQVASTLYNCVLMADMEVLERHTHSYAPSFVAAGFDAEVYYGQLDFRFRNNTEQPIRIDATLVGNKVTITLIGTDKRDYTVEITYKIDKIKDTTTVYNIMSKDNPGKHKDGDVLVQPITGYDVSTYIRKYSKDTGALISENLIATSAYSKLDQVVVKIDVPVTEPPTEAPTEAPTPAPTEAPTAAPTDAPTEAPTQAPTDAPTEAPTEEPTEAPTEAPTEEPTEEPTEAPTEALNETPTEEATEA
ncbi:MAG: VanW family protein [Oscillospiraceae bacterium]|nr:VanW family protein [Oscillospiraceae bacterium]